jgi:hypothetical protein
MRLVSPDQQGDTDMFVDMRVVAAAVIALGSASAAIAASKHPAHRRQAAVVRQVPAGAASAYGYATPFRVPEPDSGAGIGTNFLSSGCGLDGC